MEHSERFSRVHLTATIGLAIVWFYQGLVPKVLEVAQAEIDFWLHFGVDPDLIRTLVVASGIGEMVFGVLVFLFRHHRWPFVLTIVAMTGFVVTAAVINVSDLFETYNPVSTGIAMIALSVIALLTRPEALALE